MGTHSPGHHDYNVYRFVHLSEKSMNDFIITYLLFNKTLSSIVSSKKFCNL